MLHPKRAPFRRAFAMALAAVLTAGLIAGCGKKNEETGFPGAGQGEVIATYTGGQIHQGEFDKYTAFMEISDPQMAMYLQIPQFKEQFVRQFALYKVMAGRASEEQLKAADEDVKQFETQFNDAMKQNAELKNQLKEKDLTLDQMKQIVKLLASGSQIPKAKETEITNAVTDADLKTEFDKNPGDYNIVTVRHILVATVDAQTQETLRTDEEALKRAQEVKDKLDKAGDWNTLAKEYSDDPGSKDKGGLYEKAEAKGWVAGFKDAANKQEIGKIGDPVQTEFGYHVMKVEARETTPFEKLDQADKEDLKSGIVGEKVQTYLQDEEKKLDIKVTLPAEPSPSPSASPTASPSASPSASAPAGQ